MKFPKTPKVKKPKKKTRTTRQKLIDECDELIRQYLRKHRTRVCCTCGKVETENERLQVGHWIKRGKLWVRWDLRNCNPQCASCNLRHNHYTHWYDEYMLRTYGEAQLLELCQVARSNEKISVPYLEMVRNSLKEIL